MRIERLILPDYKTIRGLDLQFEEPGQQQVIIGRNGAGKSHLLESIVRIFRDLDLGIPSPFGYELVYTCREHRVRVVSSALDSGTSERYFAVTPIAEPSPPSEVRLSEGQFRSRYISEPGSSKLHLLPRYVFGYCSGDSSRFAHWFQEHESRYYKDQIRGEEVPFRPLFLARPIHGRFSLLAYYASGDERALRFLREELGVTGVDSVLVALQEPWWSSRRSGAVEEGDSRFWGASGKVAPFLEALYRNSFAPMAARTRRAARIGRNETRERRYCFIPDARSLQAIGRALSAPEFFARLDSLVYSDLISAEGIDIGVRLHREGAHGPVRFDDLAEGERQLLTVLGLLRLTSHDEALFVLDEPDTHLNPAWCLNYLRTLADLGIQGGNSQVLIATHSPITFAGLDRTQVTILRQSGDTTTARHPDRPPKGMGFAAILTSEFFGLPGSVDQETLDRLERLRLLSTMEERTTAEELELRSLRSSIAALGFARQFRDPLYDEFVQELSRTEGHEINPTLPSEGERERRAEIVRRILADRAGRGPEE